MRPHRPGPGGDHGGLVRRLSRAVGNAEVYDWAEGIRDEASGQPTFTEFGRSRFKPGDARLEPEKFRAIPSIDFFARMKAPMFGAHGTDDPVVSRPESKRLVDQRERRGVPREQPCVAAESHGMRHLGNRVDLHARIEALPAAHL